MTKGAKCRFCRAHLEHVFCDLGKTPLSNAYLSPAALDRPETFYPLKAYVCSECFLVQLDEFETPESIFSDYAYFSSYSASWLEHARDYSAAMQGHLALGTEDLVVEVASNDGYLLQYFRDAGIPVLGIEPANNVAEEALANGIPTRAEFFGANCAKKLVQEGLAADLLIGNNVLAHVPDLHDFVLGLSIILKRQGTLTLEFPHLLQLIESKQFDTIYHEHFSYFSLLTVERILAAYDLRVFAAEELPTHGGSLRLHVCHATEQRETDPALIRLREKERSSQLSQLATYSEFSEKVSSVKNGLLDFLIDAKNRKKRVAAYGAPAKGNTLLNYCGIRRDFVDYTVDLNPAKQGKFLPGTHIPIYAPSKLNEDTPDYLLILPWNLKEEIVEANQHLRESGTEFVVAIPELEVLR